MGIALSPHCMIYGISPPEIRRSTTAAMQFAQWSSSARRSASPEQQAEHRCQRCRAPVSSEEYSQSQRAFQRVFCAACFDETFLERRNFETKVELHKTIRAADGTLVQSRGERMISDFLAGQGIAYRYDEKFRILEGYAIRPDFYLPEFDLYIEYWGMDTAEYKIGMLKKQQLYQQQGKKLISLYWHENEWLIELLRQRLARHGVNLD